MKHRTIKVCRVMIEVRSRTQAEELTQALLDLLLQMQDRYQDTYQNTDVLLIDDVEREAA
jgi:chromosomal replication initiation ATPase DnaA